MVRLCFTVSGGVGGMFWCGVVYVYTHASFSNVTDADLGALASPETGVMERVVIFPLCTENGQFSKLFSG